MARNRGFRSTASNSLPPQAGGRKHTEPPREVFTGVTLQRWEENEVQESTEERHIELELGPRFLSLVLNLCFLNYVRLVHGTRVPTDTWRHGLESFWDTVLWLTVSLWREGGPQSQGLISTLST